MGILGEYNKDEITRKTKEATMKIDLKDIAVVKTIFNW